MMALQQERPATMGAKAAAVIFPGQGAQRVGMGADLYASQPAVRQAFERAAEVLGYDLASFCLQGPAAELARTRYAQPALFTLGVGIWWVLQERGVTPICAAGHSIGEFAAWVAAGALGFDEALVLVSKRAELMEAATAVHEGAMSAVLGLGAQEVEAICAQVAARGKIGPAGYNCPGQVVISGEVTAVAAAEALARQAGAKVVRLAVAGAFHSPLMAEAAGAFAVEVDKARIEKASIPVAANATGALVREAAEVRQVMREQMPKPVQWEAGMRAMVALGAQVFLEAGAGRVLTGMAARIAPSVSAIPVEDAERLEQAISALKNSG